MVDPKNLIQPYIVPVTRPLIKMCLFKVEKKFNTQTQSAAV